MKVQLLKACYGLCNAPAAWYQSVAGTMKEAGFEVLETEPCGWILRDPEDHSLVIGMACAHVDDFLFAGDNDKIAWRRAVNHLYEKYKWSDWEADSYMHCGVHVTQHSSGAFSLSHSEFCSSIDQIYVDKDRSDKDNVNEGERQQLRAALGAIQWRVYQSGPQHGAKLSALQSQITCATVHTLRETNKLIREVYHDRYVGLKYYKMDVDDPLKVNFVMWSDAAVGNRRDYSSSGGYFLAAAEPKLLEGRPSQLNAISWKAGKLPRVARSSLSAEIQAFSIAEEELMFTRLQWIEMNGIKLPERDKASVLHHAPGAIVTDARSLYDVIQKGPLNTSGYGLKEKYSVLDMMSVFQRLQKGRTTTRWVHSDAQLADALTKHVPNSALVKVLMSGTWTLVDDPNFVSAKKRRKALHEREMPSVSAKVFRACEIHMPYDVNPPPLQHFTCTACDCIGSNML